MSVIEMVRKISLRDRSHGESYDAIIYASILSVTHLLGYETLGCSERDEKITDYWDEL